MIRYLIIDDEHIAHEIIRDYCDSLPDLVFEKSCFNALEARQFLSDHQGDLIFLDLNLPKLKGFDFLRTLKNPPGIIVTTAYEEFALEGFELNVTDYLLKPFSFERFLNAIDKVSPKSKISPSISLSMEGPEKTPGSKRLFIREDKKYSQVNIDDLLFAEAQGNYTKLILKKRTIVTREKISSFRELLPESEFLQVHKSFIVAKKHIDSIEGNRISINENSIPIGKVYKMNINKLLNQ